MKIEELLENIETKQKASINFIKKNCSEILDLYFKTEKLFFRGIHSTQLAPLGGVVTKPIFVGKIRTDRKPIDKYKKIELTFFDLVDDILKSKGIKTRRKNSLYLTNNFSSATNYGYVYAIFPFNGFNYAWYPKLKILSYNYYTGFFHTMFHRRFPEKYLTSNTIGLMNIYIKEIKKSPELQNILFDLIMEELKPSYNKGIQQALRKEYCPEFLVSDCKYVAMKFELNDDKPIKKFLNQFRD